MRAAMQTPAALKIERQRAMLEIVQKRQVRTQDEIADELIRRGFHVTQATVSRDIRELGLVRSSQNEGARYVHNNTETQSAPTRLAGALRDHLLDVEFVGNLGVLRTRPSSAPLVAAAIDSSAFPDVVGTVAGDDTVLVVVRTHNGVQRMAKHLAGLANERSKPLV
jgi:transcriptional regulator of arginine metabolism